MTAVDYTASMLEEARRNAGALARVHPLPADERRGAGDISGGLLRRAAVTRNVTWNLRDPERADGQWSRVLKPGGVPLNFDMRNWYRHPWDRGAEQAHARDRAEPGGPPTSGTRRRRTDVSAMEAIARQAPLSARMRPGWDLGVLRWPGAAGGGGHRDLAAGLDPGGADQQRLHPHVPGGRPGSVPCRSKVAA